jgi:general secretion pathway protein G
MGLVKAKATDLNGHHRRPCSEGFTLIELMIVVAIISTLAAIAIPSYISSRYKAKIAVAISEIKIIEKTVLNYMAESGELPDGLSDIGVDKTTDPWGNPYRYLRLDGGKTKGLKGKRRRDKNANPVNSDFDLYSMGRDGRTVAQFTGKKARDDIVRANNGSFCDLAEKH